MDQDCPSWSALPLVLRDPIPMTSHGQYAAPLIDLHQNSARAMPTPAHRLGRLITAPATVISIRALRAHCSKCSIRELCLPVGLEPEALRQLDAVVTDRIGLKKGDTLYRSGEPFTALYAIRLGSCKTTVLAEDARAQVSGHHMLGDLLGLDGIAHERHACDAVALEDSEVCVLPFRKLEGLAHSVPALQRNLHRFLSRELIRDQALLLLLGTMPAEERLAAFLVNLAERYRERGYSSSAFMLRMSRDEIGSYLGLKLETVSRLFSRLRERGLLEVRGRSVRLLDLPALKQLAKRN